MATEKQFNSRMQQKIDTAENWGKATNFVPKKGEIIVYSDGGGVGVPKIKVGDGTTKVESLKFITGDVSEASETVPGIVNTGPQSFKGYKNFTDSINIKGILSVSKNNYPQLLIKNGDQSKTLALLYSNTADGSYADIILQVHSSETDFVHYAFGQNGTLTANKFNGLATSALELSSTDPKLAYANDGNSVQLLSNTQVLLPEISSLARITKALDFQHYDTHWRIGNLRGGSTDSLGFAFSYSADNETYTLPAYIDTNGAYHGKLANSLTLNGTSYNASSAISLSSQQLGVPSAFIAKSVSVLDCNNEKIGRVLSSSAGNTLVNGPAEIGSTGAGVLWNIPALSAPTSSINESGTWQYLHQVFITGSSGRVYLRSCSSNGTAGNWSYGEWAKVLTDKNFSTSIVGKLNIGGTNLLTNTKSFVNGNYTIKGTLQSETYNGFAVRQGENSSDDAALIIQYSPTLEANKSYTLSFWAKGSGSIQALITGYSQPCSSISSENTISTDDGGANTLPLTSSWKRYWITFTMGNWSSAASGKVLWLRARTRNDSGRVANVCGLKWENGGVATDWTPAPEDTQHETSSRLVLQSTAWTGSGPYSAVLSCSHITADNTVIVSMAAPVSQVQYETFCKAQITANAQADGSISFTAYGTKPTINLPIAITTLGG